MKGIEMIRVVSFILLSLAGVGVASAQDFTLPAGSYRGLNAVESQKGAVAVPPMREGRSEAVMPSRHRAHKVR